MAQPPLAFLSYAHFDDAHENGKIRTFAERLSGEIQLQWGEEFPIFIDRNDLKWGQEWKARIDQSLNGVTFLITILTPGYFKSEWCRKEFYRFVEREKSLDRTDLILPVYYVRCPVLEQDTLRAQDQLAQTLSERQYKDWRHLRHEPWTTPEIGRLFEQMGQEVVEALERGSRVQPVPAPQPVVIAQSAASPTVEAAGKKTGDIEPPTVVVDAQGEGKYTSVAAAIQGEMAGTRILVRKGVYNEALLIDKPIEIVGDGDVREIILQIGGAHVIRFTASMGRITNLTLRQMGGGNWDAVDIGRGRLDLEGCDISSEGRVGIAIHDVGEPRVRRNKVHDCKQGGILISDYAGGLIEENEVFENGLAGIAIKTRANPTVRGNRVHDGKTGGVFVHDNGRGVIEGNDIFLNGLAGVEITEASNPTVRGNRIHDGKQTGLHIHDNGAGIIEDNDIYGNTIAAVEIKNGGNPTLRGNRIHDNKQGGIYIHDNGAGLIENNEIFYNAIVGIEIKSGASPTVRGNSIHDGKQGGIFINGNGAGIIEDNDIFENALSAIEITTGANPTIRRNKIHDGKQVGVFVNSDGQGLVEENEIFSNSYAGVEVKSGGDPVLRKNQIRRNREGVKVHAGGRGTYEENIFQENRNAPWVVAEDCEANIKRSGNLES